MTEPLSTEMTLVSDPVQDEITTLTLRIEATLAGRAEDIPALTPMLAATVASLLYPHGKEPGNERPA